MYWTAQGATLHWRCPTRLKQLYACMKNQFDIVPYCCTEVFRLVKWSVKFWNPLTQVQFLMRNSEVQVAQSIVPVKQPVTLCYFKRNRRLCLCEWISNFHNHFESLCSLVSRTALSLAMQSDQLTVLIKVEGCMGTKQIQNGPVFKGPSCITS